MFRYAMVARILWCPRRSFNKITFMSRRFQFSLGRLLSAVLLLALALWAFQAVDSCITMATSILLAHVGAAFLGASIGILVGHPRVFGGIGAALMLPAAFVVKVFNC
jgi:hypothetical protein